MLRHMYPWPSTALRQPRLCMRWSQQNASWLLQAIICPTTLNAIPRRTRGSLSTSCRDCTLPDFAHQRLVALYHTRLNMDGGLSAVSSVLALCECCSLFRLYPILLQLLTILSHAHTLPRQT
jgi:hypothetical protein